MYPAARGTQGRERGAYWDRHHHDICIYIPLFVGRVGSIGTVICVVPFVQHPFSATKLPVSSFAKHESTYALQRRSDTALAYSPVEK